MISYAKRLTRRSQCTTNTLRTPRLQPIQLLILNLKNHLLALNQTLSIPNLVLRQRTSTAKARSPSSSVAPVLQRSDKVWSLHSGGINFPLYASHNAMSSLKAVLLLQMLLFCLMVWLPDCRVVRPKSAVCNTLEQLRP